MCKVDDCDCVQFVPAPPDMDTEECVACVHGRREHEKDQLMDRPPARLSESFNQLSETGGERRQTLLERFGSVEEGK